MSIDPFKKTEFFRFRWDGIVNRSQIRIKESGSNIEIQKVSQNVFSQFYNKIIKTKFIKNLFGEIKQIKPSMDSSMVLNKEGMLRNTCNQQFAGILSHRIKENVKKIQKQLDNSLENDQLKPFAPKLRQLKSESDQIFELCRSSSFDFDLGKKFLHLAKTHTNIQLQEANKWASGELLTENDVLNYAANYSDSSEKSMGQFAADTTGKTGEELRIEKFATHTLGLDAWKLSIKPATPGLTSGASGEPVYMVREKDSGKLLSIIKIKPAETVTKEINALRLMKKQGMQNCHFPEVMGIGKCKMGMGTEAVLFAQSPAKGLSIDKYIELTGGSKGIERINNTKILTEAVKSMAMGMAELHNKKTTKGKNHFEDYRQEMTQNIDRLMKNSFFEGLPLGAIKEKISLEFPFESLATLAHGDFHPGNVFYSESDTLLTLIDNDSLLDSLSLGTLNPTASYDFSYCYLWIIVLSRLNKLTQQEIKSLVEQFEKQYIIDRKMDNEDHLKQEIEFMKAFVAIKYISLISYFLNMPNHPWYQVLGQEQLENLRNLLMEDLKKW